MADIFVSYTSSDRDRAHWIARELEALGQRPRLYEEEVRGGDSFYAWMRQRLDAADHALCVISEAYLKARYSLDEFDAASKYAAEKDYNFLLPVVIERCRVPVITGHRVLCELFGMSDDEKRSRFRAFIAKSVPSSQIAVSAGLVSNIPIGVPRHFMGRDEPLADIDAALRQHEGRVAITALYGLRGVGKTVLAVAYAERHRGEYRATWWIRAETEAGMRADLVALGVRLAWVFADAKEEPALLMVMERLRREGEGILLIFDNATDADTIRPYLPRGGASRVIITSNAPAWRGVAEPVEIRVWPKEIGADYLIDRSGRTGERDAAEGLSGALGGLPLAHEQAGAYCERLDLPLAEYRQRFDAAPADMLDTGRDAPAEYHDRRTVAKTFALAIDEAAKLHPAAESLIINAALLAPEPIPLFLFAEAREKFGEPLASALTGDGLDEAIAALRTFALIDRESIADERDPAITINTIRLHRLVREVAAARHGIGREAAQRALLEAMAAVYPADVDEDPKTWPRARQLDALALALVDRDSALPNGAELPASSVMDRLASYRREALGAYAPARRLYEHALAIREKLLGAHHPDTAASLHNLAWLLWYQRELAAARPLYDRALATREIILGVDHPDTARSLNNLAMLLQAQGSFGEARPLYERALAICEKARGPEHPDTAKSLGNLASLLQEQGRFGDARPLYERALAIHEKALGPEHPVTATSLSSLGGLLHAQGKRGEARSLHERALGIREKALGPEHPDTAKSLNNLALLRYAQGNHTAARLLLQRAVAITEKALGPKHPTAVTFRKNLDAVRRPHPRR